jgi:hypothetical protein
MSLPAFVLTLKLKARSSISFERSICKEDGVELFLKICNEQRASRGMVGSLVGTAVGGGVGKGGLVGAMVGVDVGTSVAVGAGVGVVVGDVVGIKAVLLLPAMDDTNQFANAAPFNPDFGGGSLQSHNVFLQATGQELQLAATPPSRTLWQRWWYVLPGAYISHG